MRLALTVVSPMARHTADLVLDADPATPVRDIATELERLAFGGFAPYAASADTSAEGTVDGGAASGSIVSGSRIAAGNGIVGASRNAAGAGRAGETGGARVLRFPGAQVDTAGRQTPGRQTPGRPEAAGDRRARGSRLPSARAGASRGAVRRLPGGAAGDGARGLRHQGRGRSQPRQSGRLRVPGARGARGDSLAGGPGAGAVHRLSLGDADIGNGQRVAIAVNDPALPEFALRISVDNRGSCQVVPFDGVRALLDSEPLEAAKPGGPASRSPWAVRCSALRPTRRPTRHCTDPTTAASTSTGRRGCCHRSESPSSSFPPRQRRANAARCRS